MIKDFWLSLAIAFAGAFAIACIVPARGDTFDQRYGAAFPQAVQIPSTTVDNKPTAAPEDRRDVCQRHGMVKRWSRHHTHWNCK